MVNKYDKCKANKIIDGYQFTITWYVDDVKISHVDKNIVTKVIKLLEDEFGNWNANRGKEHSFLGMSIVINKNKTV